MTYFTVCIEVESEIILLGEFSHFLVVCRTLYVGAWCIVIEYESASLLVPNLLSVHFIERINGLKIEVIDLSKIYLCCNDFTGLYFGSAAVLCKYFSIIDKFH